MAARLLVCNNGVVQTGCMDGSGLHRAGLHIGVEELYPWCCVVRQERVMGPMWAVNASGGVAWPVCFLWCQRQGRDLLRVS